MQVHTVYSNLPVSDTKLKEIQAETEKDTQLAQLRKVIQDGWPEERRKCPQHFSISEFWNHRDELSRSMESFSKERKSLFLPVLKKRF